MTTDPIMAEIFAAYALARGGDRRGARDRYQDIWSRVVVDPEPMHAMTLAHYMADVQDNPADELSWDIRALNAALQCTDGDIQHHSATTAALASFMPSLHANLAEDYLKLGDLGRAMEHLAQGRECVTALPDNAYGQNVRDALDRLAKDIAAREIRPGAAMR